MSQRRPPNNDNVQIRLDMRALLIGGGILAAIVIFGLAFAVGRIVAGGGTTAASQGGTAGQSAVVGGQNPAALPAAPNAAAPAAGANPPAQGKAPYQLGGSPSDPAIPVPPNLQPVGADTTPIGDNPRLALPELVASKYVYDFGELGPTDKVEKTLVLKNDGTKPLVIDSVKST